MAGRRLQVTFDATDPHGLARWWAALLDYEVEDGHEFVSGLLADGVISEEEVVRIDGRVWFAAIVGISDPTGEGPRLLFQRVPEAKVAKNRVHLDLPVDADQLDAEVNRVVARGAELVRFGAYPGHRWAVLHDPEGNEFCLH